MAIQYVLVKKVNPQHENNKEYFYAKALSGGHISGDRLAEEIQDRCSLTVGDCKNVWSNMVHIIASYLNKGYSVEIPYLGTIYVTVKSEAIEKIDDNVSNNIRVVGPKLRPCKELSKEICTSLKRVRGDKDKIIRNLIPKIQRLSRLMDYFQSKTEITRSNYQRMMSISRATAQKDLNVYIELNYIKKEGHGPFTYYTVVV